jgi:hypothetical protein
VKAGAEAARMTPQLLRGSLLPGGARNLNGDERHKTGFLLDHFVPTKAALHYQWSTYFRWWFAMLTRHQVGSEQGSARAAS